MAGEQLRALVKRFGGECHYCGDTVNRKHGHPKQATKDHVVPKIFGGTNSIDNYVLACHDCNNDKGSALFYCMCSYICGPLIDAALSDDDIIGKVFEDIVMHNRAVVRKSGGVWKVYKGYQRKTFNTWAEAMAHANSPVLIRGRV